MRRRSSNYRRRESSVEQSLVEMYLAGVSVRRVEDITEALWTPRTGQSHKAQDVPVRCAIRRSGVEQKTGACGSGSCASQSTQDRFHRSSPTRQCPAHLDSFSGVPQNGRLTWPFINDEYLAHVAGVFAITHVRDWTQRSHASMSHTSDVCSEKRMVLGTNPGVASHPNITIQRRP